MHLAPTGPHEHVSTREGYQRWAKIYDVEDNPLVALEQPLMDALIGDVYDLDALDLGCGTGRHTATLVAGGARVTALDFSQAMLDRARAKPQCAAATFKVHDLNTPLPLADQSLDRIVCGLVMEHLSDVPAFLREMRRVCRATGFAAVSVMHPAMWLAGVQARFTDPDTGVKVLVGSYRHTVSEYVTWVLSAGWRIAHISEHAVGEELATRMPKAERYLGWPMLLLMKLA